jgi:hypothetical protein
MNATLKRVIQSFKDHLGTVFGGAFAFFIGTQCFHKTKTVEKIIPQIVTQYDTVEKRPEWLADSIKKWKKVKFLSDTHTIVIHQTIVDTQYVPVDAPPDQRPNIWPVLTYHGDGVFGDTAFIRTFSVRTGKEAVSKVFIGGYLTDIDVEDANNPTPKLNYKPFPPAERHNWLYPIKKVILGVGIGFGTCTILEKLP